MSKSIVKFISRKSPQILTGLGIAGVYVTAILSSRATLKASEIVKGEKETRLYDIQSNGGDLTDADLSWKDIVKVAWKEYIPAAVSSLGTVFCIIQSDRLQAKRHAAVLALYSLSETAFREYQNKTKTVIGENKEQKIRDEIYQEKVLSKPAGLEVPIIRTRHGEMLCYDAPSDRYFLSDVEKIRRLANDFNMRLRTEMSFSLNDWYYELGLPQTRLGESVGFDIEKGLLDIIFSSHLNQYDEPCLVIDYKVYPL